MIGSHPNVRRAVLDHLQYAIQYAGNRAIRFVLAFVERALPVKVPEELVRAVDEVDDHEGKMQNLNHGGTEGTEITLRFFCFA